MPAPAGNQSLTAPGAGARGVPTSRAVLANWRERLGPILASSVLPFALVLYLGLEGGGYDSVVRNEVGIALWWIVLLGALVGVLPVARFGWTQWMGLGLLGALAGWTALGIGWSESSERSVEELARILTYLGVFALALAAQGREALRRTVRAVAAAIALIAVIALVSWLQPTWIESNTVFAGVKNRLSYPLGYWNGLAALIAIGLPLVIGVAAQSRRLAIQAVATAAVPAMALAAYYTLSRGGAVEVALALIVLLAIHPRRLDLLPTLLLGVIGSGLAIAAATQRDALEHGARDAVAAQQGDEMLAVIVVVCAGVALLRVALGLAVRHRMWPRLRVSPKTTTAVLTGVGTAAVVGVIALAASGVIGDAWDDFKNPAQAGTGAERLTSANGEGRYQLWDSAIDASSDSPLTGIGPGTYEYWWAEQGDLPTFVRDAHSLYLETLAELGLPGLLLLVGLIGWVFAVGFRKLRAAAPYEGGLLAACLAAFVAFAAAGVVDWVWEMSVIPVAFLLVAAAVLRTSAGTERDGEATEGRRRRSGRRRSARGLPRERIALATVATASLVLIAIPLLGDRSLIDSRDEAAAGKLGAALDSAESAGSTERFAASPSLQEALILELQGDLDEAAARATDATRAEATNWRTWLTLSRIEAKRGNADQAVAAYRRARSLNPRSQLFQPVEGAAAAAAAEGAASAQ